MKSSRKHSIDVVVSHGDHLDSPDCPRRAVVVCGSEATCSADVDIRVANGQCCLEEISAMTRTCLVCLNGVVTSGANDDEFYACVRLGLCACAHHTKDRNYRCKKLPIAFSRVLASEFIVFKNITSSRWVHLCQSPGTVLGMNREHTATETDDCDQSAQRQDDRGGQEQAP